MEFNLYRCRDHTFLANDAQIVSEHINRDRKHKAEVTQLHKDSVVIVDNQTYSLDDLIKISRKHIATKRLRTDKPLSIMLDNRFIK